MYVCHIYIYVYTCVYICVGITYIHIMQELDRICCWIYLTVFGGATWQIRSIRGLKETTQLSTSIGILKVGSAFGRSTPSFDNPSLATL